MGRVLHFSVSVAQANGLDSITTTDGLSNVSNSFVVHNNGIDVHVPFSLNVPSNGGIILGQSPSPGPCEGKDAKGMNASVVGLFGSEQTARSFSHEVGHYLGLGHQNDHPENLMCQSGSASSIRNSVILTNDQGNTIKSHCLVKPGC